MSSNERPSPKSLSTNESNIPISKRFHVDSAKKSKKRNNLPELQRYIETIVRAQNDYDRENGENGKGHKNTKKVVDVLEKLETAPQPESKKQSEFKPSGNVKKKRYDGGEREIKIREEGIKKVDDSYECDMNPILEIEKFLRKLYPNPYDLDKVSEFQVLKASQSFQEEIDHNSNSSRAPSVFDTIPSSVDITHSSETLVSQISTEDDSLLKADMFSGQNMLAPNFDDVPAYSSDNYFISNISGSVNRVEVIKAQNDNDNIIDDTKMPSLLKMKIESRIGSPLERVRSRPSSTESESRHLNSDNSTGVRKKRNFSRRTSTDTKAMPSKNNSDALVVARKQNSDHLGKLNLLTSYDSNEVIQGDTIDERSRYEEEMSEQTKKIENIKKASKKYCKNPTELYRLYHVMDKTAESILQITSRNGKDKDHIQTDTSQDGKTGDHGKSLEPSRKSSNMSTRDLETVSSSDRLQRTRKRFHREHSSPRRIEQNLRNKSALLAAFQKEKSKCEKEGNVRTKEKEGGDDDKSRPGTKDNEFRELSGTDPKIDNVLQYMCDCLRKFTNDNKELTRSNNEVIVLENVESKNPKSVGRNISKDTKQTSCPEGNPTTLDKKDVANPTASEHKDFSEDYSPLEIVRNRSLTPVWSLDTVKKQRRRKRPQSPKILTKSYSSEEKTLEMSPICLASSSERLIMSSLPSRRPEIPDITLNDESILQIVEPQSELGGYNEELPQEIEAVKESQPKVLYPFRFRKEKRDSYCILKNALDTEEKLLTDSHVLDEKSSNNFGTSFKSSKSSVLIKGRPLTPKLSPFSLMEEIKQQRSSFVICVSSVPRHLRTGNPKIPYATSLSISLSNLRKSWGLKKVGKEPKTKKLKKLSLEPWAKYMCHHYRYRFEMDSLLTLGSGCITHAAIVVGLAHVYATSAFENDVSFKNSECPVKVKSGPPKKSLFVENLNVPILSTSGTSISTKKKPAQVTSSMILSIQRERIKEEEDFEIEEVASERTLEESDENMLTPEQSNASGQLLTCSGTSITYVVRKKSSDSEAERDRKKIQDLLLRTYHLQHKLHRYLHRITCHQTPSYYPLKEKDTSGDLNTTCKSDESELFALISPMDLQTSSPSTENKDSQSQVYWLLEPSVTKETQTKGEHDNSTEVEKVDHATSYHPPSNDSCRSSTDNKPDGPGLSEDTGEKEETPTSPNAGDDDDEDDRSSTCSFKSSNEFSESNEMANVKEKSKVQKNTNRNSQFLQMIFQELEQFRKAIMATKDKQPEDKLVTKPLEDDSNALDKPKDDRVTEIAGDGKPSGKALKTVFKGKESTTELTIGLKDVPITEGSNISVEKTKFSQNHTKISISISKEKPEELYDVSRRFFKFASDKIHSTLSSYYFDSLRPTLSECETKYSRLENGTNKSLNDSDTKEEEDEEVEVEERNKEEEDDDYKSVASSVSSDLETDKPEEREDDEKIITDGSKTLPTKTFAKHRFDFYRKMNLDADYDADRTNRIALNGVSKYKELEPLKEALTEMQMRMRKLKRNSYFTSSEYYQRALKLAKMSAGFCHTCGSRSLVPENSFSTYRNLCPRRYPAPCRKHYLGGGFRTNPNSSFYSFRSSSGDLRTGFCDLDMCHSSYILSGPTHSAGPVLGDVPIFMSKM